MKMEDMKMEVLHTDTMETYGDLFRHIGLKINTCIKNKRTGDDGVCPYSPENIRKYNTVSREIATLLAKVMFLGLPILIVVAVEMMCDAHVYLKTIACVLIYAITLFGLIIYGCNFLSHDVAAAKAIRMELKAMRTWARRSDIDHGLRRKIIKKCRLKKTWLKNLTLDDVEKYQNKALPWRKLKERLNQETTHI